MAGEFLDQLPYGGSLLGVLDERPHDLLKPRRARQQSGAFGVVVVRARLGLVNIEVGPGLESLQASESIEVGLQRIPLPVEPRQLGDSRRALLLQLGELSAKSGDLSFVGPAEDPTTGVVDAVPIVS